MVNMFFIEVLGERYDDKNTVKASWHFFEKSLFVHRRNCPERNTGKKAGYYYFIISNCNMENACIREDSEKICLTQIMISERSSFYLL
jgi:hypothetical protein